MRRRVYLPGGELRRFRLSDTQAPALPRARAGALALGGLALWLGFTFFLYRLSASDGWQGRAQALLRGELLQIPFLARASVALGSAQAAIETRYAQTAPRPPSAPAAPPATLSAPLAPTEPAAPSAVPATTVSATPSAVKQMSSAAPSGPAPVLPREAPHEAIEPARNASAPGAAPEPTPPAGAERQLPSCEELERRQAQVIDFAAPPAAVPLQALQRTMQVRLEEGSYFAHCGLPASSALTICAAVEQGRVVGVSVTTEPHQAAAERCVRHAVQGLGFPASPELEVFTTRFAGKH